MPCLLNDFMNGGNHEVRTVILNEVTTVLGENKLPPGTSLREVCLQTHPGLPELCRCPCC